MAVFTYQGTGEKGERRSGELEAASRSEALRQLMTERIQPLQLVAKADKVAAGKKGVNDKTEAPVARKVPATGNVKLNKAQVIHFTDELADFLHSGLQLEPALQLMENREDKGPIKDVSAFLREKVRDGTSFSDALKVASPNFGELYCNLVAAGEISGALSPLLRRQASHLIAMQDLRGRVQVALIYPTVLVLFGIAAMTVFMTVLVPQMINLFTKTHGTMPLPTLILVTMSRFTQHYGLFIGLMAVISLVAFVSYVRQPAGRRWWDEAKLNIPLIGPLLSASFYAQFCQTMANLLQNGLPLLNALKLMSRATGNVFYQGLILKVTDLVGEGASLTRSMKSVGHFPANLRDLVKVGEQTGDLGSTMEKIGERYDKLIQERVDKIMTIVPLIIISALGLMVALIAWAMVDGIFQVMKDLQAHH